MSSFRRQVIPDATLHESFTEFWGVVESRLKGALCAGLVRRGVLAAVVVLVLGACGSGDLASSTSSASAPTTSTTLEQIETEASPTDPSTSQTATSETPESWDLVVFGDSFAALTGWPAQYADLVAAEFGVEVSVDGDACWGGCAALDRIRASEELRGLIGEAEVVVVQAQPGGFVSAAWRSYSLGDCGGEDGFACFRKAEDDFRIHVEELLDEVTGASQPGAIVRAMRATGTWVIDYYNPGLSDTDPDRFDAFLENTLILSTHVAEAAADRCILALDVNAIMSGTDYRQPLNPDYSNDGSHPSKEGSRVIAEALHDLGYEPRVASCDMPGP